MHVGSDILFYLQLQTHEDKKVNRAVAQYMPWLRFLFIF